MRQLISDSEAIVYPDSDGQPMADNTEHFELIVWIEKNLEILFSDDANVFIAGDLLWYPVKGENTLRQAPDVLVVFGRPKGYRGSYQQWEEANIPPQVVFEIWSPGNRPSQMMRKLEFYQRYGVEEYYLYHPQTQDLTGWQRTETGLDFIDEMKGWVSPRLGVRFDVAESGLQMYRPDGERFLTFLELDQQRREAEQRAQTAEQRLQTIEEQLEAERVRSQILAERLREMGIDLE